MENSSIPDLENNGTDEAVLEALLKDAKKGPGEAGLEALLEDAKKGPGEAALAALFAKTDNKIVDKTTDQQQDGRAGRQQVGQQVGQQRRPDAASSAQGISTESVSTDSIGRSQAYAPEKADRFAKKAATYKAQMLIVHADSTQLSVLEMSFISEGYDVVIFETGKEALNFLKKNVPDIMLLDADMEKLTGMDICFRIRKIKRFETVPVIIMTEAVDDRTETMVKMCHANDFFPKAHKNIELKAKVRKLIDQSDVEKITQVDVE